MDVIFKTLTTLWCVVGQVALLQYDRAALYVVYAVKLRDYRKSFQSTITFSAHLLFRVLALVMVFLIKGGCYR